MVKVIFEIQTLLTHTHRHVLYCLILSYHFFNNLPCFTSSHTSAVSPVHRGADGTPGIGPQPGNDIFGLGAKRWEDSPKSLSHFATQDLPIRPIKRCKTAWTVSKIHIQTTSKTSDWLLRTHLKTIKHWLRYQHVVKSSTALLGFPRWWRLGQCWLTSSRQGRRRDSQAGHQWPGAIVPWDSMISEDQIESKKTSSMYCS